MDRKRGGARLKMRPDDERGGARDGAGRPTTERGLERALSVLERAIGRLERAGAKDKVAVRLLHIRMRALLLRLAELDRID
jgi:hypothetical protein